MFYSLKWNYFLIQIKRSEIPKVNAMTLIAQSAGAVEYIDCTSTEE